MRMKENQIEFRNVHQWNKSLNRTYYGIIELDKKEVVEEYVGKFRSEAKAYFEELARLSHGRLKLVGVFKN